MPQRGDGGPGLPTSIPQPHDPPAAPSPLPPFPPARQLSNCLQCLAAVCRFFVVPFQDVVLGLSPPLPGTGPLTGGGPSLSFTLVGRKGAPAAAEAEGGGANASSASSASSAAPPAPALFDGLPSSPLRIGVPAAVQLNNMECTPLPELPKPDGVGGGGLGGGMECGGLGWEGWWPRWGTSR